MLIQMGEKGTLIALLVCGHILSDFVFQTQSMVKKKERPLWLLYHVCEVVLTQGILLLPFLSRAGFLFLLAIGISHGVIDRVKIAIEKRDGKTLAFFFWDQAAHLAVLLIVWLSWSRLLEASSLLSESRAWIAPMTTAAALVAAYAFNWNGAAVIVGTLLQHFNLPDKALQDQDDRQSLAMGRAIGILERMIVLTLVLVDQWGALGLVLAAKSIARFKDLEKRCFGEYYLIGTLTSVLIAIGTGLAVRTLMNLGW